MYQRTTLQVAVRILTVLFLLISLTPLKSICQGKVKNVVIFFSYGPNLPAFEEILAGLKNTIMGSEDQPVNIMTEYLDLNRSVNDDHAKSIINLYNAKLNESEVDLLITVGPGANNALLKYGCDALRNMKMINVDLDMPGRTTLQDLKIKNGKEIILKFRADKAMKHAFDLFPDHKEVFVISGVSKLDAYYTSIVRNAIHELEPDHHFHFISNLTLDSTLRFAKTIPKKSIVFVSAYLQDAANLSFSVPEVTNMIAKNTQAPVVLCIADAGFRGHGGVGGFVFSYTRLGQESGRMAHEILNGKQMEQVSIQESNVYEHMYDWNELKKWHLTGSKVIPSDSTFYNKNTSFLQLYKWYILGILLFILSQTILIIYLFRLNKRQKAITEKMLVTEGMHRELIHTDRLSKMSMLTASLSHELFQPLAAIRFTAQAGKQFIQADKLNGHKASEMFENILEDEMRATKLIRSVKGLMKAETPDKGIVNLNALISETLDLIHTEANRGRIKVNVVFEADPVFVQGDKIQLQQVLMNFVRNAITAMEKNDPQNKMLEIVLRVPLDDAIVSVLDSGPGLNGSVKENLFKPFITTKKEGFGIGLTLCKSLIEKHHGKIWAENIPDGGAMFSFSLPVNKN